MCAHTRMRHAIFKDSCNQQYRVKPDTIYYMTSLRMRTTDNGEIWQLSKLDAAGGPETRLPIGVA